MGWVVACMSTCDGAGAQMGFCHYAVGMLMAPACCGVLWRAVILSLVLPYVCEPPSPSFPACCCPPPPPLLSPNSHTQRPRRPPLWIVSTA